MFSFDIIASLGRGQIVKRKYFIHFCTAQAKGWNDDQSLNCGSAVDSGFFFFF